MLNDGLSSPLILAASPLLEWLYNGWLFLKVLVGFSAVIFVHELGHFLAAKWMGIRVDRFAIGFFQRVVGYRPGEGLTFGTRPEYTAEELAARGYGETDYCLNILPFGGYVRMLGQDDIIINEETGEIKTSDDPRSFTNKPVHRRMVVVSAGVIFNVIFAILAYALIFAGPGKAMVAPVVTVEAGGPAAEAGLLTGDRIVSINDGAVRSFVDVVKGVLLSSGPVTLRVQRDGQEIKGPIVVHPRPNDMIGRSIGVGYMYDTSLSVERGSVLDGPPLVPGDRLVGINDQPVESLFDAMRAVRECGGQELELQVARGDPDTPEETEIVTYRHRPLLAILPADPRADQEGAILDSEHLLGFVRRLQVRAVLPDTPAEKAGFQAGDVIAEWGNVPNPRHSDIKDSIEANEGRVVPVVVDRGGTLERLEVVPRREFTLFSKQGPRVGIEFIADQNAAVVADIARETPAVGVGLPRGARIVAIDDTPITTWIDVFEQFKRSVGSTVSVRYETAGDTAEGSLTVPPSVTSVLDLPPMARIDLIAGERDVRMDTGRTVPLPDPRAVRLLLEKHVGETITVSYVRDETDAERVTATFAVTADNLDPWQLRCSYALDVLALSPRTENVSAGGNPFLALWMGTKESGSVLRDVYLVVKGMFTPRSAVSPKNVSGPVGIFKHAIQEADTSYTDLLYFLAYISVNLAVINFLPLPVVDGGLMVFLLLEKIRGKPLSIKVQVTTTLIGLALIVGVFLLVTFQDITQLWQG